MQPTLSNFQIIRPPYEKPQSELNTWLTECHLQAEKNSSGDHARISTLLNRYAVKDSQISKRAFECADIENIDTWNTNELYQITKATPGGLGIAARNKLFANKANRIMQQFYEHAAVPQHLIHVSCTGYTAPNAAQLLVAAKGWNTQLTNAYHMGCYAAFPAVRMAAAFLNSGSDTLRPVDIVHNEMCGLHLNPLDHSPEQIIVQSLFADGHIKYSILAEPAKDTLGLRLVKMNEVLIPDSIADMSWALGDRGMQMTLSREVPEKIQPRLREFVSSLGASQKALFAIHPGGPKIIEAVQKTLELTDEQCAQSKKILFECGNMSSATLPHIWAEILAGRPERGQQVCSLAFGPGLTLFGALFEVI